MHSALLVSPTDPESVPTSPITPNSRPYSGHGRVVDSWANVALRYTAPGSIIQNDMRLHGLNHVVLKVFAQHLAMRHAGPLDR